MNDLDAWLADLATFEEIGGVWITPVGDGTFREFKVDPPFVRALIQRAQGAETLAGEWENQYDALFEHLQRVDADKSSRGDYWFDKAQQYRKERDVAVAHDTQPYPTAWAYEKLCERYNDVRDKALRLVDKWEHMNDAYRAKPRSEMRYYLEPENAAKALRAALYPAKEDS